MKKFEFYQDVKTTIWVRQYFTINASTQEEANKLAMKYKDSDVSKDLDSGFTECDALYDTETLMRPEENDGFATMELYNERNELIGCNGKY